MTTAFKMPGQKKAEDFVNAGWDRQVTAEVIASRPKRSSERIIDGEETKRLTIDIPISLHKRMRLACVEKGITHADVIRRFLDKEFPEI
jgi:hypothetical protein